MVGVLTWLQIMCRRFDCRRFVVAVMTCRRFDRVPPLPLNPVMTSDFIASILLVSVAFSHLRPDSLPRLWRYINLLLTYLLTYVRRLLDRPTAHAGVGLSFIHLNI